MIFRLIKENIRIFVSAPDIRHPVTYVSTSRAHLRTIPLPFYR